MEFLDGRSANGTCVLALDNDYSAGAFDDVFHQDVPPHVGLLHCLPDVLVPEIPEHVLHQVLELEP
jgi:hypothetical protein